METDAEVTGDYGNSYTTEFRQYDPRLMRWKSLDPLMSQFPWMSPYVAFDNNPVYYTDPLGLYSEKRAERKAKRMERKGYENVSVVQSIDKEGNKTENYGVNTTGKSNGSGYGHYFGNTKTASSTKTKSAPSALTLAKLGFNKILSILTKIDKATQGNTKFVDDYWVGNSTETVGGGIDWRKNDGSDYSDNDWEHITSKNAEVDELQYTPGSIAGGANTGSNGKLKQPENWATRAQDILEKGKNHPISRGAETVEKVLENSSSTRTPTSKNIMLRVWWISNNGQTKVRSSEGPFKDIKEMKDNYPKSIWNNESKEWELIKKL